MPPPAADGPGAATAAAAPIDCDALVIGAGPVGLFQVFQLGLLGISAQVVDVLPEPGGQCIELYPDKPIYDIPALPVCTGRELAERLLTQVAPFHPGFHLGQEVSGLAQREDGRFDATTTAGQHFIARSVFIAAGVGAFVPRPLKVEGAEALPPTQLFYRPPAAAQLAGRQVLVLGGEEGAVQAAVTLADAQAAGDAAPAHIHLLHRRATLQAEAGLLTRLAGHAQAGRINFIAGQVTGLQVDGPAGAPLQAVQLATVDGHDQHLPVDALVVQLGISPRLGPISQWGLAMERRQLLVDPARFETSQPGLYAVGDVVSYPGKKKLILCGFHEATLAAHAALARLRPGEPQLLQYSTTSMTLQRRLGVAAPGAAGLAA